MNVDSIVSCSGCGACAYICPFGAISIRINNDGFFSHTINKEKCVDCGKCLLVCSHRNISSIEDKKDVVKIDAAISYKARANIDISENSSSGGIAYLLMKSAVENNKNVVGVLYNPLDNRANLTVTDNLSGIDVFRGSKYLQADPSGVFAKLYDQDKQFVFIGSPCQVYGFSKAVELQGRKDSFLFVDFFCHGVPSYLIWDKMVKETIGNQEIESVSFRDKQHGYHKYVLCYFLKDGRVVETLERKNNPFYQLFDSCYLMSPGCYDCPLRNTKTVADIRIGDYWDNACGEYYSRVAVCTSKGGDAIKAISHLLDCEPTSFRLSNDHINKPKLKKVRRVLLDSLRSSDSITHTVTLYENRLPIRERLKNKLKEVLFK